jgi:hypothetical protein
MMAAGRVRAAKAMICQHFRYWHFCDMARDAHEGRF